MNIQNKLMSIADANRLIDQKRNLVVAGEEANLTQLHQGNWVGGTIPYFMNEEGGLVDQDRVFVTDLGDVTTNFSIKSYKADELAQMLEDRYQNGFSYVLMPAFSDVHSTYALKVRYMPSLFDVPTMGWITGVHLDNLGKQTPKVIDGRTGTTLENELIALHCQLPEDKYAELNIINIYEQSEGDVITFPEDSFSCTDCFINGEPGNLADYYLKHEIDQTLPLVADHGGALINADIKELNKEKKEMSFFAPLLSTQEYRLAEPIENRYQAFTELFPEDTSEVVCACNCVSSYFQLGLEGKKTGEVQSPFTFGEIAYILVNQTMVLLSVKDK